MNCTDAVAALVASLEKGTRMTDQQREHISSCERCRALLDSAKEFQSALEGNGIEAPRVEEALAAAEGEAQRVRVRRMMRVTIGVMAVIVVGTLLMLVPLNQSLRPAEVLLAGGLGLLIAVGFAIPVIAIILLVRRTGRHRIYKRLGPGRMLSGVCMGIAETTNVNLTLVRLGFLVLLFVGGGIGFWLYVLLDLAMPVHPDDRQYLLRFRLRRRWENWSKRRSAHAEHHVG